MSIKDLFGKKEVRIAPEPVVEERSSYPYGDGGLLFGNFLLTGSNMMLAAVFGATNLISNSMAQMPIYLKRIQGNNTELMVNHPVMEAFDSMLMSRFTWMKMMIMDVLKYGNGYSFIKRDKNANVKEIIYLEQNLVSTVYNPASRILYYVAPTVSKKPIEPCNMIHFLMNSNNGVEGRSIFCYGSNVFNLAKCTDAAAKQYFNNGLAVSGVLTSSGPLNDKQKTQIRADWQQVHGNGTDSNGLVVLSGSWDYKPISNNGKESQMLETRQFNVIEIARLFNINPTLLGDLSKSSYNTLEQSNLQFLSQTLMSYVRMVEDELNRKLLKPSEKSLKIDMDENAILRTDKSSTANYLRSLTESGILSINEARHLLGYGDVEGGDENRISFSDANQNKLTAGDGNTDDSDTNSGNAANSNNDTANDDEE